LDAVYESVVRGDLHQGTNSIAPQRPAANTRSPPTTTAAQQPNPFASLFTAFANAQNPAADAGQDEGEEEDEEDGTAPQSRNRRRNPDDEDEEEEGDRYQPSSGYSAMFM